MKTTIRKIKVNDREMYEITCDRCGKKIISFGENQAIRNMDIHRLSCKIKEEKEATK